MIRCSVVTLAICLLTGCVSSPPSHQTPILEVAPTLQHWLSFTSRVNELDPAELEFELDIAIKQRTEQPDDDESRLRLGYLLSRQHLAVAELDKSQMLLAKIDSASAFAPLRDLVMEELTLKTELHSTRKQVDKLHTQVNDLESQVNGLQTQLDALKAIETDLTVDQKELEELPQ